MRPVEAERKADSRSNEGSATLGILCVFVCEREKGRPREGERKGSSVAAPHSAKEDPVFVREVFQASLAKSFLTGSKL